MGSISTIEFKNEFVHSFEGDDTGQLHSRQTPGMLYARADPSPVSAPQLLAWSEELGKELGISKPAEDEDLRILSGNSVLPSMRPYAACYGGHQFGYWSGQLGDGRAITLGEMTAVNGETRELQLKGAGRTAYSRRADGRAVLRSSVREYLMSEAMFYLGVPTTRALSLVSTGDKILRDMFYDGHPAYEPGAIVMRVAPSFLRFGNYEILTARKEHRQLEQLVQYTIDKFYPHIQGDDRIIRWFREIVERTASLMVEWLRVGFVHGVMNTDNMSILGLTIDYGPYSFLDDYDPNFTPNTTDLPGRRYAFGRQPSVALWNLGCLAGALVPLFPETSQLENVLKEYDDLLISKYQVMMANKLGLDEVRIDDPELFRRFEEVLSGIGPDMTMFYQLLIDLPLQANREIILNYFSGCFYTHPDETAQEKFTALILDYCQRRSSNTISEAESRKKMSAANPRFIMRNYLLSQAIEELEKGETRLFKKLQEAMKTPYSQDRDEFFTKRPAWATEKAGCSMLSCSS